MFIRNMGVDKVQAAMADGLDREAQRLDQQRHKANGGERKSNGKAEEPGAILNEINALLSRFVIYPSEHARTAHVLWIVHSHLMSAWESTPRTRISIARTSIRQNPST